MSRLFFDELEMPEPTVNLGVGSGSHAAQTAAVMSRFEPVLRDTDPDLVIVVGDVNSTLACALVAAKAGVPVAHVEAGLRSFDRTMPEEVNRVVADAISDLLYCSEVSGVENLRAEGKYKILTPDGCIEYAKANPDGAVCLFPLCGGTPPESAWRGLELYASKVLPHIESTTF